MTQEVFNILVLQQYLGQPVAYLKDDGIYAIIGDNTDGMLAVYPILDNGQTKNTPQVRWLHPDDPQLITLNKIFLQLPENSRQTQAKVSTGSEYSQAKVRKNASFQSETFSPGSGPNQQQTSSRLNKNQRRIADYYRLDDFSVLYSGHLKEITHDIFLLTIKALSQTSKTKTINKILNLYEQARRQAQKGSAVAMQQLRDIHQRLETLIKQQELATENRTKAKKKKIRQQILYISIGLLIALSYFGHIGYKNYKRWIAQKQTQTAAFAQTQKQTQVTEKDAQTTPQKGYYLIAGSYRDRQTAREIAQTTGAMIIESNGLYRIAVAHYPTLSQARKAYYKLKSQVPDIWILKIK